MSEALPLIDQTVDASGMQCPMPLLKAKQMLNRMASGQVLQVLATDAGSWRDFHTFAGQGSHELLSAEVHGQQYRYLLRKG